MLTNVKPMAEVIIRAEDTFVYPVIYTPEYLSRCWWHGGHRGLAEIHGEILETTTPPIF